MEKVGEKEKEKNEWIRRGRRKCTGGGGREEEVGGEGILLGVGEKSVDKEGEKEEEEEEEEG
jgi:hypothetical protein